MGDYVLRQNASDLSSNAFPPYLDKMGEDITWTSYHPSYTTSGSNLTASKDASGYSLAEQIVIGCVLSMFIILSTAGNILVCVAVVTERNLSKLADV